MAYCDKCGEPMRDNVKVCPYCGYTGKEPPKTKKKTKIPRIPKELRKPPVPIVKELSDALGRGAVTLIVGASIGLVLALIAGINALALIRGGLGILSYSYIASFAAQLIYAIVNYVLAAKALSRQDAMLGIPERIIADFSRKKSWSWLWVFNILFGGVVGGVCASMFSSNYKKHVWEHVMKHYDAFKELEKKALAERLERVRAAVNK